MPNIGLKKRTLRMPFQRNPSLRWRKSTFTAQFLDSSQRRLGFRWNDTCTIVILIIINLIGLLAVHRVEAAPISMSTGRLLLEHHQSIQKTFHAAAVAPSQILIKAHIVNIDRNYTRELGLTFSTTAGSLASDGGFNMNLPTPDTNSGDLIIPIAALGQGILLDATLSALEKTGHAQLISDPQLITLNRQTALIEAGQEVPYQQSTEGGGTSVAFKKAVLRLQVTPEIKPQKTILLHLLINQDQVSELTVNGVPAISTQQLKTQVLMKNHNTVVLGGILQDNQSNQHQGIPWLSKIPWLGALFRYQKQANDHKQLLIFVTPIIL